MYLNKNINRYDTHSIKYNYANKIIPLCVADMDFLTSPKITEILSNKINKSIYGYTQLNPDFYQSIQKWMKYKHNWEIDEKYILHSQSILSSLSAAVDIFTNLNDEIILLSPEYHAFYNIIKRNGRKVKECKLKEDNGYYSLDFEKLKNTISKNTKMLIFSSPHNPIGKVWSYSELKKIGDICIKNNILIISDEIHSDIVYKNKHIPIAKISNEISNITITLNSPSKSFNLVGLTLSYIISTNIYLLEKLNQKLKRGLLDKINICTNETLIMAYTQDAWLKILLNYLEENIKIVKKLLTDSKSKITFKCPEATYLIWLDFRALNLTHQEIKNKLENDALLILCDGNNFGTNFNKFFRLNIATQEDKLREVIKRLINTF